MEVRCGHDPTTGLYYERLGSRARLGHPVLWIHGGGATGACFRETLDGGPGWADQLASRGAECWVTDWPGIGRSGNRNPTEITYDDVVAGYRHLLREVIAEPALVVCHSMGGAVAWQLIEHERELVAGVVSLAGAYPANVAPTSTVEADDGRLVTVVFADTGVRFEVDRLSLYLYEDAYVYQQAIATSKRFPMDRVDALRAGFVGLPPKMLLQRLGVLPGLPLVRRPERFEGVGVRLVAGTEDPAHTHEIEVGTRDLLRSWGADARLVWLADHGIEGNGHFFFFEDNQETLLALVAGELDELAAH